MSRDTENYYGYLISLALAKSPFVKPAPILYANGIPTDQIKVEEFFYLKIISCQLAIYK